MSSPKTLDDDEHLAYGDFHRESLQQHGEHERTVLSDVLGRVKSSANRWSRQANTSRESIEQPDTSVQEPANTPSSNMAFFDRMHSAVHDMRKEITKTFHGEGIFHTHTHPTAECSDGTHDQNMHRFQSFAPQRTGNDAKWYVDGCGYFWAVSVALERAQESIWILDWWLSPELYLRRPPAKHEQYRIDRMLKAAAERGVKVNIIVYKEVTQALTLSSSHTKHALEDLHPNICVFRHPDHLPDKQTLASSFFSSLKHENLTAAAAAKLPGDALKAIYGMNEDTVLYWAHHEKLCLIDGTIAFMGGLDLCFGRYDTNQHSISDVHPSGLENIIFPGQDYNNARIMDFQDVAHWQNNKLDRKWNSRMGWSDLSISLAGPIVEDLRAHFAQRWNFIYNEKYDVRKDVRYQPIDFKPSHLGIIGHGLQQQQALPGAGDEPPRPEHMTDRLRERFEEGRGRLADESEQVREQFFRGAHFPQGRPGETPIQLMRSCTKWSHGVPLEHSIANAYIQVIRDSQHFVYIENQFFITATNEKQKPIQNKIGAAIVERILRAARNKEQYKMIVNIPAIPGFAGDLRSDDALSTRAIMEFQYNSINRGGHSIYESLAREGVDPTDYIRFYNLRNYDRINGSSALGDVEKASGVSYDDARRAHDQKFESGTGVKPAQAIGEPYDTDPIASQADYEKFQNAASTLDSRNGLGDGTWDSVASCYMANGTPLTSVPWSGSAHELEFFVSEELYIHTKILIADDRVVIVGSANLNDRSQLGSHDSEIAVCITPPITDPSALIQSTMAGKPWTASRFAASLRRQLFRKHLGLIPPQDPDKPDANFLPIGHSPNHYDWDSHADKLVTDPLGEDFTALWTGTAERNTEAFERVFHPVPSDKVRSWKEYDTYYERFFSSKEEKAEKGKDKDKAKDAQKPSTWKWGHIVAEEFDPDPVKAVTEVKEILGGVRGTLVDMPLLFLREEDIAKEGLSLNAFTEEVYT